MKRSEKLLAIIAAGFILAGLILAFWVCQGYRKGREGYQELNTRYTTHDSVPNADMDKDSSGNDETEKTGLKLPADAPEHLEIDWENLLADYEDIVAWIQLPSVDLSYPVMQADDNDYYLHRAPDGSELFTGSIFMDCQCSASMKNYNTILYGHNMRDGSMFARLKQYNELEVFTTCPYFWIYTPGGDCLYRIFSVHTTKTGESTYMIRFANQKVFTEWLREMEEASEIDCGTDVPFGSRIVTLSTCTGDTSTRQVVQGYLILDE